MTQNKRDLLRFCGWFFAGNILLFWLIGLKYVPTLSWVGSHFLTKWQTVLVVIFFTISYLGQLALLAFWPAAIIAVIILVVPQRHFILLLSAFVAACSAFMLIWDAITYSVFHFHLNGIVLNLVFNSANEQFFDFSALENATIAAMIIGLLFLETVFAYWLWKRIALRNFLRGAGISVASMMVLFVYASYSIVILTVNRFCVEAVRSLPGYTEILGSLLPVKNGQVAMERIFEKNLVQPDQVSQPLHYPLQKLTFSHVAHPLNILVIGVDTWRFDMLNPQVTPHIYQFAKRAIVFNHHFSGGNATGPGVFSLFYGLPATYWTSMEVQHRPPVLLDELQKKHYQFTLLASAGFTLPPFDKTVFQGVKNLQLQTKGEDPWQRDMEITREFNRFLDHRDTHSPFFSFLFYDSSHSYCRIKNNLSPFHPVIKVCNRLDLTTTSDPLPYFNRYRNALVMVDREVGKVLDQLEQRHLLENTVVIITGDHGEEFNENHMGYWGHTSNFTHYQIQTPLILWRPHGKPQTVTRQTSHFDIAPTLMESVLGCHSPADQYSIGRSLLTNRQSPPFLVESSYIGLGVIEKDQIVNIFPTGSFQITGLDGQNKSDAVLKPDIMHAVYQNLKRFYASS